MEIDWRDKGLVMELIFSGSLRFYLITVKTIPDFTLQQTTANLRLAQGRVIREKGMMKAATEAVFFMPELESLAFIIAAHSKDFSPRCFLPSIIDLASS